MSFEDLKVGLANLKERVSRDKTGVSYFKDNICTIFECLDALEDLYVELEEKKLVMENLDSALQKIQSKSDDILKFFKPAFHGQVKAALIRRCALVLPRFRFILDLPTNMLNNIQKGDYDIVIKHYARFKLLFENEKVDVLKKVCSKVEEKIQNVRQQFLNKLKLLPPGEKEQLELIKLLVNLETPGDVPWQSIMYSKNWLCRMMTSTYDEHENESPESLAESLLAPSCLQNDSPSEVQLIMKLSRLLSEHFPNFWKLGQAYLSGKLHEMKATDIIEQQQQNLSKSDNLMENVQSIINKFSELIKMVLKPQAKNFIPYQQTHSESLIPWIPHCFTIIRECCVEILKLDLPQAIQDTVKDLIYVIQVDAVRSVFKQAANDISQLDKEETWLVEMDIHDKRGLTHLPVLFKHQVKEVLFRVCETLLSPPAEEVEIDIEVSATGVMSVLFHQANLEVCIKNSFNDILCSIAVVLEKTAFCGETQLQKRRSCLKLEEEKTFSEDEKLLIVLKNCDYTLYNVLPQFDKTFTKYGYLNMIQGSEMYFDGVDMKIFNTYMEHKHTALIKKMEEWMFANQFSWDACLRPTDVSVYVKEILMCLTEIHCEVHNATPSFIPRVLMKMLELIGEEMLRLFSRVKSFEGNGNIQACLDLRALSDVLSAYQTSRSRRFYEACHEKLAHIENDEDTVLVEDLLEKFKQKNAIFVF